MQREVSKDHLEGSMVLVWIKGAVYVVPVTLDAVPLMLPLLGAFQGKKHEGSPTTILQLCAAETKAANALAAQINAKRTTKGTKQ